MAIEQLKQFVEATNIVDLLDDEELKSISQRVLSNFNDDMDSMHEWLDNVKKVMDIASLVGGTKNYPLPNSANIKFPLITKACYEFISRIYPEIIKDGKIVRTKVIGKDINPADPTSKTQQAQRVAAYMNYQLLDRNEDWEQELDKLLTLCSLIGMVFTKTYYDPIKRDICNEVCDYNKLIIHSDCKSLHDARRVSHVLCLHMNDLLSGVRAGIFDEAPIKELLENYDPTLAKNEIDVVEQHCYLDLDGDDYEEPYIVTFLKDNGKILRIYARFEMDKKEDQEDSYKNIEIRNNKIVCIKPVQHFTDFHFLPSPKGKFHSVGFGTLMYSLNATVNSLLNQLVDAGQLANLQGGYIDSLWQPVATGNNLVRPGEFIKLKAQMPGAKLADGLFPFTYKEPSTVLFQLMGTLVSSGKELSSSTEIMTGAANPENNKTGATMALIKEGEKVHTAIQKRIYRALTDVFRKIFHFNGQYLDPHVYVEVTDSDISIDQTDFDESKVRVLTVADPNLSSEMQRAAKVQMLAGIMQLPGVNQQAITQRIVMGLDIEAPEELLAQQQQQQPSLESIKLQHDMEHNMMQSRLKQQELELEAKKQQIELLVAQSNVILNRARALQAVAQADQAKSQANTDVYDVQLKAVQTQLDHMMDVAEFSHKVAQTSVENDQNQQEIDNDQDQQQSTPDMGGQSDNSDAAE